MKTLLMLIIAAFPIIWFVWMIIYIGIVAITMSF